MTNDSSTKDNSAAWLEETSSSQQQQQGNMWTCRFNQDGGCLAVGGSEGFTIFNLPAVEASIVRPLQESQHGQPILMEMLFRCNLLAFVGHEATHRVLIWDDHVQKAIGELSFRQSVLNIRLRRDAIAIALRDRTYVYHLSDLSLRDKIYTADNPHGLLSISTSGEMVLACPSVTEGHVRVELYGLRKTVLMEAHESALRAVALTEDGTKLATASGKGTVIRVWQVATSTLVQEFRRGVERVTITCLTWNPLGSSSGSKQHLACTSEKGTTHVFEQRGETGTNGTPKKATLTQSVWSAVKSTVSSATASSSYSSSSSSSTESNKSIAQVRGVFAPKACAFVGQNLLGISGYDMDGNGVLLLSDYTTQPEPTRHSYHVLCKNPNAKTEETEEARRRRRLLGDGSSSAGPMTSPSSSNATSGLYIGERVEVLENQLTKIKFEEESDGFLNVVGLEKDQEKKDKQGIEETKDEVAGAS